MEDFNQYSKRQNVSGNSSGKNAPNDIFSIVSSLAQKFDGKSQGELLKAIYDEALKGKRNGTLTNAEIDNFYSMIYPMFDDKQRKMITKVVTELKKI